MLHYLAATAALLSNRLASEGDTLSSLCTGSRRLGLHTCLDLAGHGEKGLFNIGRGLGRSLQKLNAKGIRKLLSLLGRNDTLGGQIGLVTNQKLVHILTGISINFMQPLLYIVEGLIVSHIIHNNDTMSTTVIRRCDCTETFLSSGIPNLKLDRLAIELNGTDFLNKTKVSEYARIAQQNLTH